MRKKKVHWVRYPEPVTWCGMELFADRVQPLVVGDEDDVTCERCLRAEAS